MANVNAPYGARPVMMGDGSSWNGKVTRYYIPSSDGSAFYVGDFVKSAAGADANGVPAVAKAAASNTLRGAIVSIEPVGVQPNAVSLDGSTTNLAVMFIPATKTIAYYVYVCDDPDVIFRMKGDTTGTNQVAANANKNANFTVAAPSAGPWSASVIDSSSIAVTQALPLRLLGLVQQPGNVFGASADWLIRINQHELMGNVAGV